MFKYNIVQHTFIINIHFDSFNYNFNTKISKCVNREEIIFKYDTFLDVLHVVGVRTAYVPRYVPKVMQKPKSLYKPDHHWSTFRFYCGPSIVDHWIQLWGHLNDCEEQVTLNKHVDHFFFC